MARTMSKHDEPAGIETAIETDWAERVSTHPDWDQDLADDLIGAIVLVGITEIDDGDEAVERLQMWGMVESADPDTGIEIELHGELAGESWVCPPALDAFERAEPGVYTVHSTGEKVVDPDFTTSWTVTRADEETGAA